MASMTGGGPGTQSGSFTWLAGAQPHAPASGAFPGALVVSWIRGGTAGIQTNAPVLDAQ